MPRFEHEIVVARPPADVFAYLADLRNLPTWQSSLVEVRPHDDSADGTGSRFTEVRSVAGRRIESTAEVAAYEPERELTLRVVSGPFPATVRHLLAPAPEGTRLRVEFEVQVKGMLAFAGGMIERQARRQAERDLEQLRQALERTPG